MQNKVFFAFLHKSSVALVETKIYFHFRHKTASNLAILGELGMIPCSVNPIKLSVGFWHHVNSKGTSLIRKVYDTIINSSGWHSSKIKLLFDKKYIVQILLATVLVEIKNVSTQHLLYLSTMSPHKASLQ
jgi:hypothetical protein